MTRSILISLLVLTACGAPAPEPPAPAADPGDAAEGPPGIILLIGDGTGLEYWSAGKLASGMPLAVEDFDVVGLVDTEASNSRITDSAAGATAYAAGVRTFNSSIGLAADSSPVPTVLEVARSDGWAAGLVATSSITHATPASFAAHVPSRNMQEEIARQMAEQDIEVILGGGRQYFDAASRQDSADVLGRLTRGATYIQDAESFHALDMDTVRTLVGLFAQNHPDPAPARSPNLAELTRAALTVLEKDPDGFFLMVEGSQIDWRGHDNAPLREVVAEVLDFDMAIREALVFQERRPNTLIVVTADHSTGGFVLNPDSAGVLSAHYTTEGHTYGMVPLFAHGPHAAAFAGIMDNDQVGRLLLEIVRDGRVSTPRER